MEMTRPYLTNRQGTSLVERITEIRKVCQQDGWLDGSGKAVTQQSADLAAHVVPLLFHGRPDHKPFIYPNPGDGIDVEVDLKGYSYFIDFPPDGARIEIQCVYRFDAKDDSSLELHGLTKDDFVVVLDDWIEFL